MADQANSIRGPWRRFLRFSVRGMIVLVLVIGAGLGWIVRSASIQREAVAAIEKAGGGVFYDWHWNNVKLIPAGPTWAPRWAVDLIGEDYFRSRHRRLAHRDVGTDATMAQVGQLTRLERLNVDRCPVSDAGLASLKGLTELSELVLSGTRITDAGMANLTGLTKLVDLDLQQIRNHRHWVGVPWRTDATQFPDSQSHSNL